jgi:YD repeat-containing protein
VSITSAFAINTSQCAQNGGTEYCEPKRYLWGSQAYSVPNVYPSFDALLGVVLPQMLAAYNPPNRDFYPKWAPRQNQSFPLSCYDCTAYTHKTSYWWGTIAIEDEQTSPPAQYRWLGQSWPVEATLSCPIGMTATTGGTPLCSRSGPDPEKDLGPPCDSGSCQVHVANPVQARSGNKFQREVDYVGQGPMPLQFVRYYNSGVKSHAYMGAMWRHSYEARVVELTTNSVPAAMALRGDGRSVTFSYFNGAWATDKDTNDQLVKLLDGGGAHIGWQFYSGATEDIEVYDVQGKLSSITARSGLTTTLTYSDATTPAAIAPRAGLLIQVTDPFGRSLGFTYNLEERIATLTDPDGQVYLYTYDAKKNLSKVTYPDDTPGVPTDNPSRIYHYEHASCKYALTGISDETAQRYATWGYDSQCRATSSQHAGGADSTTLGYNGDGTTTVTDARGTARQYTFQVTRGVTKLGSVNQPCASCGSGAVASMTYDANGNVASTKDFNGKLTCRTWDLARNLETQRVEGLSGTSCPGTPVAGITRTTTTEWHSTWRLPVRIAEPKRMTTYQYDSAGNVTSKSVQATTDADGSAELSASTTGSPRTWTYSHTYHGSIAGFVSQTVVNGPRTDVTDTTTYSYDSSSGTLATVTNALGHVTSFSNYDAHGRPLRITDPNGLATDLTYDVRGRLTSRSAGGETTSYAYDAAGQLQSITLPDGSYVSYTYDAAHRLTQIEDNLGNKIVYTVDAMASAPKRRCEIRHRP